MDLRGFLAKPDIFAILNKKITKSHNSSSIIACDLAMPFAADFSRKSQLKGRR